MGRTKETYYTPGEAAELKGVSRYTIHYHINHKWKGKVKKKEVTGQKEGVYLIPKTLLDKYTPDEDKVRTPQNGNSKRKTA